MNSISDYNLLLNNAIDEIKKLTIYRIDSDIFALKEAFDIAYENKLYRLFEYDQKIQDDLKLKLFTKITPFSGSLSFLSIQILAANTIMNKNDFHNKEYYFDRKCGIAINHLRANKTIVSAKKCKEGFRLKGKLAWASGYKIFDDLLIGFHHKNKEYEAIVRFKESAGFSIINTAETFVGQALNTVNIELDDFFIPEKDIISSQIMGNYTKNKSISKTVHFALYSLGKGAINSLEDEVFKKIAKKKLKKIKKEFLDSFDGTRLDLLRVELFNLVQKIITTGIILYGGKSVLATKNLQRYYRELIMFNSNGLNDTIKGLFLDDFIFSN